MKKEELDKLNQEIRKTNRRNLELKKKRRKELKGNKTNNSISGQTQKIKFKALTQIQKINKSKERKLRKKSLVLEFKKIKQEIEEEIKRESKCKKKHNKSLFSSINNPLSNDQNSIRKLKLKHNKNSTSKQNAKKSGEISANLDKSINKDNIRKFIKDKQKKTKEKESLEKSQEIEKHYKVQENLKILYAYIKKIRNQPFDDYTDLAKNQKDLFFRPGDVSKSDRGTTKRSETSKRSRRANNRSRLYENEHKLFEQMLKGKNNQSLDTTANKKQSKHIKYTTLLSKDKSGGMNSSSNTAQLFQKDKTNKHDGKLAAIDRF